MSDTLPHHPVTLSAFRLGLETMAQVAYANGVSQERTRVCHLINAELERCGFTTHGKAKRGVLQRLLSAVEG